MTALQSKKAQSKKVLRYMMVGGIVVVVAGIGAFLLVPVCLEHNGVEA